MQLENSASVGPTGAELRILVIATQIQIPGTGGGETHVGELVAHLREHGQVLALTRRGSSGPGVLGAGLWPGLPPRGLAHPLSAANLVRSIAAVRAFAPNVIYERGSSFGLGAMYSRLLGIPMLTMLLDEHMSPLSLRQARFIITTDPELVQERFRHKAVRVSWGANTRRFVPGLSGEQARRRFGIAGDDFVVGYCGTFRPWHGLSLLLDVAERLQDPTVRFLMIGEQQRARALIQQVQARNLGSYFVFTDRVPYDQVPATLAAADVCVAPFDRTTHGGTRNGVYTLDPLKVFEYLALEKPVVTIAEQNLAQLFRDREHLRLIPERDADALVQALISVRRDPEAAKRMARAGRKRVEERHTWAAHSGHLATLFRKMIDMQQ